MKKIYHSNMKFNYRWSLKDYPEKNGLKVFSTFACGGGSTMGYKLAGFEVLGCNEIDPRMMEIYKENHNPKYSYLEPIQDFKNRADLPPELYNLDILDGSPPCSTFSMAGNREGDWGKEKKFREGQSLQVLDTLFFDFIDLTKRLQPKVAIAENVTGLMLGKAIGYAQRITKEFEDAGYHVNEWVLDASKMGVPQKRHRVFFIAIRKDFAERIDHEMKMNLISSMPHLDLNFDERKIPFHEIYDGKGEPITEYKMKAWHARKPTDSGIADSKKHAGMKVSDFNHCYIFKNKVMPTITGKGEHAMSLYDEPIKPSNMELILGGTFPIDYEFMYNKPGYVIGMSVPPVMVAQIASRIKEQWFDRVMP